MLEKFIPYSTQSISQEDTKAALDALCSTHLTQGQYNQCFEKAIAKYIGIKHAISFNSATSALYAAFCALKEYAIGGVYCKNERYQNAPNFQYAQQHKTISIITTSISFVATTNMMLAHNIVPIFADIDSQGNISLNGLESLLREDTLAICSVDYAGNSVNMNAFQSFAKKHNLLWISDSSHAFGATYHGQKVGSCADMSIFSFHAVKPFTTCEGGALVCHDDFFASIASLVCSHGMIKHTPYNHDCTMLGFNFRLHEVSAALGLSQLNRLSSFLETRRNIAQFYDGYFANNPYCQSLEIAYKAGSTYHLYPLLLCESLWQKKEFIANELAKQNVGVQVHYKPIYNFSAYRHLNYKPLPRAEAFYNAELSIPCHHNMSMQEAELIAHIIAKTLQQYAKI